MAMVKCTKVAAGCSGTHASRNLTDQVPIAVSQACCLPYLEQGLHVKMYLKIPREVVSIKLDNLWGNV